jgi:hypothetical protein
MKILGITDEITSCDCCGRTNLKCTVVIEDDLGNLLHFGRTCASMAMGWGKSKEALKQIALQSKAQSSKLYADWSMKKQNSPEQAEIRAEMKALNSQNILFNHPVRREAIERWRILGEKSDKDALDSVAKENGISVERLKELLSGYFMDRLSNPFKS